uniref:Uncharacterized protein n=1 Tax=Schistocephalus solidus TaxID=70667 RepID=A0A0X3Q6M4_SCHSO
MDYKKIPGFFYDETCDRYFKIEGNNAASRLSASSLSDRKLIEASEERLNNLPTYAALELTQEYNERITGRIQLPRASSALYGYPERYVLTRIANARHRQHLPLDTTIARPTVLDSHGGTRIHVIDSKFPSTGLRQYRVCWSGEVARKASKRCMRWRFSMSSCPRSYEGPNCHGCNDATWLIPGRRLACVSPDSLSFLKCSGTGYELLESVHLRRLNNPRFAQPPLVRHACNIITEPGSAGKQGGEIEPTTETPVFFTNQKIIIYDGLVRLLLAANTTGSVTNAGRRRQWLLSPGSRFTALAKTEYLPVGETSRISVYIGSHSESGGSRFGLFSLEQAPRLQELIRFSPTVAGEVTSLQCLLTSAGDRYGLLVGRRNGLVQLWEDRWPAGPAVTYWGSDSGCLTSSSSPIPPQPAVEVPHHTSLAAPILGQAKIGLWQLKTGRLMRVLSYTVGEEEVAEDTISVPPPLLLLKSEWGIDADRMPTCGPALLSINLRNSNWFCD